MTALILLLLAETWPVVYGEALLEELHSYDLLAVRVTVAPGAGGADIDCRLTLRVTRPGPLRFLLSRDVTGLAASLNERPVEAELGAGGFERVVRVVAPEVQGVPSLLTLRAPRPLAADEVVTFRLRYRWQPRDGWAYVGPGRIQTHLSSFWLPTMADERFDADVGLESESVAVGPGEAVGGRFRSVQPVQLVCLTAGDFAVHSRVVGERRYQVLVPPGVDGPPLLDDLVAVMGKLEEWFGPVGPPVFRLVVEPSPRPAPSYCADAFTVVHRSALALPRERWLAHLAHECSHLWWGHHVATPVIGRGGTWLREGLAQWSGAEVAGALQGPEAARELWRANFRGYLRRIDLRRRDGVLFANEASLRDATYLDDLAVAYLRGALVFRRLQHELGTRPFLEALRRDYLSTAPRFADFDAVRPLAPAALAYYVETTRLPDFELVDVRVGPGRAEAVVRCRDARWPGGRIPIRLETTRGVAWTEAVAGRLSWEGAGTPQRIEVDPERIHLDPIRSNNVWVAGR